MKPILLLLHLNIGSVTLVEWILGVIALVSVMALLKVLHGASGIQLRKYLKAIEAGNKIQKELCNTVQNLREIELTLKEAIRVKDDTIKSQAKELQGRKQEIAELKAAIVNKDEANEALNDMIGRQNAMIKTLQRDVQQLKEQQVDLRAKLGLRNE